MDQDYIFPSWFPSKRLPGVDRIQWTEHGGDASVVGKQRTTMHSTLLLLTPFFTAPRRF